LLSLLDAVMGAVKGAGAGERDTRKVVGSVRCV